MQGLGCICIPLPTFADLESDVGPVDDADRRRREVRHGADLFFGTRTGLQRILLKRLYSGQQFLVMILCQLREC